MDAEKLLRIKRREKKRNKDVEQLLRLRREKKS